MTELFLHLAVTVVYIANFFLMRGLGWLLTEFKRPLIAVKPFNCRPCISFWLTLIGALIIWLVLDRPLYEALMLGALWGFINYLTTKIKIND